MPATEQTWRDQKQLHVIFGVSGVVMLLSTVWMFDADHRREWKHYQKLARNVDLKVIDMRERQEMTADLVNEREQMAAALQAQRQMPVDGDLLDQFKQAVAADAARREKSEPSFSRVDRLNERLQGGEGSVADREALLNSLRGWVKSAKFREDDYLRRRKFRRADFDQARAKLDIAVRDNLGPDVIAERQAIIDEIVQGDSSDPNSMVTSVDYYSAQYEAAATHRQQLDELLNKMTAAEDQAKKDLDEKEDDLNKLDSAYKERRSNYIELYAGYIPIPGKKFLELPILDAFGSPLKIENQWSEGLLQDYNFSKVRRFDRCTTCHQAIDKTKPGTADQQAFVHERLVTLQLQLTPPAAEEGESSEGGGEEKPLTLKDFYGIELASEGLLDLEAPTVALVFPESLAAKAELVGEGAEPHVELGAEIRTALLQSHSAHGVRNEPGLLMGDIITEINGDPVYTKSDVMSYLLSEAEGARRASADDEQAPGTLTVVVRRGLPHPYASHPRLDLFVGSLSPHAVADFACTICHDGQGSGTAFKWSSHTPSNELDRGRWAREHGWFDNHHWIYPMYAKRFSESACLKCHHDVTELEPSDRFPDPPAPKLMQGYNVIRRFGCYGCHEVNGFDGPDERVGPDMRVEPNYSAAALQLASLPGFDKLSDEVRDWTDQVAQHPDRAKERRLLRDALIADENAPEPLLPAEAHGKLATLLQDTDTPGKLRKPGPSLRFVGRKLDPKFMYDWIDNPRHFRPDTRMPRFFGLWDHLQEEPIGLSDAQRLEPMAILGIGEYLRRYSQNYPYLDPPQNVTTPDDGSPEQLARGKAAFQERGCLACHSHKAFADAEKFRDSDTILQGPDLSAVGSKFDPARNPNGRRWLYSWIKNPTRYNARTVMPDLFLDPIEHKDAGGNVTAISDPAADIAAFLLAESKSDWTPTEGAALVGLDGASQLNADQQTALNELALEHLKDAFFETAAADHLKRGIPHRKREGLKNAESELLVSDEDFDAGKQITDAQRLLYIGRKSIAKYGCYGCHDIPGFEDAKPIGTGLADWGRKDPSKLAFEHVTHYLAGHGDHGGPAADHAADHEAEEHDADHEAHGDGESAEDAAYYHHLIESGHREGFIYQKLREPRSYDYRKTENKKYNERLKMPQFSLSAAQREAVITFVLGLVADPPSTQYVYSPGPREKAILEGRQVLDKYNCAGCHLLQTNRWRLALEPTDTEAPDYLGPQLSETQRTEIYPFLFSHYTESELEASEVEDRRGRVAAHIAGMPSLQDDGLPRLYDNDEGYPGDPLESDDEYPTNRLHYAIDLWKPTVINGHPYEVGVAALNVSTETIEQHYPSRGGMLARYLLPHVVQREKQVNPAAKGAESWGWVPPPLVGEGAKVQSNWLHDFLLEPYMIRPAVVLRMPKFNLSPDEATKLARYFAAVDNVDYPYQFSHRRQYELLEQKEQEYQQRLAQGSAEPAPPPGTRFDHAVNVAVDKNYCRQCHIIADFEPAGSDRAKAPNLSQIYLRLRPQFVRDWIARPVSILPYTSMPINIPYSSEKEHLGGVSQQLYHGTSIQQVDGLVDWLMNYDQYAKQRTLIAPLVKPDPPAEQATGAAAATGSSR